MLESVGKWLGNMSACAKTVPFTSDLTEKERKLQQLQDRTGTLREGLDQWNQHREVATMTIEDHAVEAERLAEKLSQKVNR